MSKLSRYLDIRSGNIMVVTDLHGDGDAFDRYVTTFETLRREGEVDRLIFLGDLIHGYGSPEEDDSLRMILDVIALREKYGDDTVTMVLGNHEMPHIYGVSLAKGDLEFTPRFERALGKHRKKITNFLMKLPFAVRTSAGVLLCHAGPDSDSVRNIGRLRHFSHKTLLNDATKTLNAQDDIDAVYNSYAELSGGGKSYAQLAQEYLAVENEDDPRFSHLLRALFISERDHRFSYLWDFLFSQNERGISMVVYEKICDKYLGEFSANAYAEQKVCVSGHIRVQGGFQMVNQKHLRLASAAHASPREAGGFLLFDASKKIERATDLEAAFHKGF